MSDNYISNIILCGLKSHLLDTLNKLYSSQVELGQFSYNPTHTEKRFTGMFNYLQFHSNVFKIQHLYCPDNPIINFENFDPLLERELNNLIKFCSLYYEDVHFSIITSFSFDKIFKNRLLNNVFPPKLEKESLNIELILKSDHKAKHGSLHCIHTLSFDLIDGKFMLQNEKNGPVIHPEYHVNNSTSIFRFLIDGLKSSFGIPEDIIIECTQTEQEFEDTLLVLKMNTI